MNAALTLSGLALSLSLVTTAQPGSSTNQMDPEILVSILPPAELKIKMADAPSTIDHQSEVSRSVPATVVIRTSNCQEEADGRCRVNADVVVYRPDGSIHQQVKVLELSRGRGSVALDFPADAPPGLYRVVAQIRDMVARRFGSAERQFGVN